MKWNKKYLSYFEKPFAEVPQQIISEVRDKLSSIQSETPLASVVVIAYNDETRLFSCLWSLSETICKYPIEIIGVDNNSADRTAEVFKAVGIPHYTETKKSCGHARNRGLQEVKGKYYICIDSDTMYPPFYVEKLVNELEKEGVVAVSANWSYVASRQYPRFWMRIYEFLRDVNRYFQSFKRPELSVRGLVFAYVTDLGREVGYRVDIIRGEDGSMAYGLTKYGKIKFLYGRETRAVTCTATVSADGSLWNAFKVRVLGALKGLGSYFTRKRGAYKDHPSNIAKQ